MPYCIFISTIASFHNEAIVEIKMQYGKDVFATCTDNEAKMVKMKEVVLKEYSAVLTYGCNQDGSVANIFFQQTHEFAGKRYWQHCHLEADCTNSKVFQKCFCPRTVKGEKGMHATVAQ